MSNDYEYKLSVVVIVYNTENFIEECLDSLVNQTLDGIEIICVNDESTDNSLNILKQYAKKYDNIKIIDQKNQGGAVAGNNGLKQAKGEYVALIDSDDIVVYDAYEKLYNKAKETGSDIVGGKPAKYINGNLREISLLYNIWLEERTIDPNVDFDIYHDVFYWDKIYKRELIEKHDIYMIPGKLYADAPLVFKAYFYAKKITLITDIVYYWRKRSVNESITKSLLDVDNMHDRLITYYYLKEYFQTANKDAILNDFIKIYLERFFYPLGGILKDELFESKYLNEIYPILNDIPDIYNNKLNCKYNLYIYFILNGYIEELKEFIMFYRYHKEVFVDNGKSYWNLKYFRNPEYNIPDNIFEIDFIHDNFISLDDVKIDSEYITFENIRVLETLDIDEAEMLFIGVTKPSNIQNNNILKFKLNKNEGNSYSIKIPVGEIKNITSYNIFLKFKYDGRDELFRIKESTFSGELLKENISSYKYMIPYFSKLNNLSIINAFSKGLFDVELNENEIRLLPNNNGDITYKVYIEYKHKSNRVYFDVDNIKKELKLDYVYSLDEDIEYSLNVELAKDSYSLTPDYFKEFKDQSIVVNNHRISLYAKNDKIMIKLDK